MKVLLVEEDELLSAALSKVLEANHYTIDLAVDGQLGLDLATTFDYDLILLDVQLPRLDGISLCRQLRARGYHKPILLLTASNSDADAVAGFDAGADDYISKPCAPEILLARVRTWLRRGGALLPETAGQDSTILTWGRVRLDLDAGRVMVGEQEVFLTATEYNLLELFLRNSDRIFSRSAILDRLWGAGDAPTDRAIVTHVKDLRKKLKAGGLTEDFIETIYGMGYRLKPAPLSPVSHSDASQKNKLLKPKMPLDDRSAIAKVQQQFQAVFVKQAAVLAQATTGLQAGSLEPDRLQAAKQEAHKLAGSLASFGYPEGSKLARSIEHLLIAPPPFAPETITRLSELATALQQTLAKPAIASPAASVSPHRVLVVDDDIALTERLKVESHAWGFHLKIAATPTEARLHLLLDAPDVVVLDLSFPETEEDGLTFLQEITERSPNLPVIVFTGRDSLVDRLAVSRLGGRHFLQKTATPEQMFRAIARILTQPPGPEARVLIVDDDPAMLTGLSHLLAPWGLEVAILDEPCHFWKVLVETSPNLILLDLEMPHISGLELCQVVRQDAEWGDIPILVVTAHTDAQSLQQAFAAGADDFITKPVLGPELVTRVLSRIERHRSHPKTGNTGGGEGNNDR